MKDLVEEWKGKVGPSKGKKCQKKQKQKYQIHIKDDIGILVKTVKDIIKTLNLASFVSVVAFNLLNSINYKQRQK